MRGPRITTSEFPAPLERLVLLRRVRYAVPIAAVALAGVVTILLGRYLEKYACLFIFFAAILLSNVLAGLGPGLLATALSIGVILTAPPPGLTKSELIFLATQGVLVSIVGGTLRTTRLKARERLAANLNLEQRILEIGDDERRRIGHDLHDGLGQHLTGISLLTETMSQEIEAGKTPDPDTVENITRLVSEAVRLTRDLAKSLSPVTLEQDGLVAAIEELAEMASSLFGIRCNWESDSVDVAFDRARSLHLFRIVQEAVNNSVRHGKARNVRIGMIRNGESVTLTVADDGSGLSEKTMHNPGLGLRIMEYRARMLGAALSVERASSVGGTVVTCTCPIDQRAVLQG